MQSSAFYREKTIIRVCFVIHDNVIIEIASNQDWPYQARELNFGLSTIFQFEFLSKITLHYKLSKSKMVIDIYGNAESAVDVEPDPFDRIDPTSLRSALRLTGLRFDSRFNLRKGAKASSRKACHSLYTSEFETGSN